MNKLIDKAKPSIQQAIGLSLVLDDTAFGPHVELNTNRTSARLLLDLESIRAIRAWCDQVLLENNRR